MNGEIMEILSAVTEEEREILGGKSVDKSIYTTLSDFTIEKGKISEWEKLIDCRKHTRFAPFPRHKHDYIELIYNCSGKTVHNVNFSKGITLFAGDMLLIGENAEHSVEYAGKDDIAVNFLIKREFFSETLGVVGYGNIIYNYILSEISGGTDDGYMLFKTDGDLPVKNLIENLIYEILLKKEKNYAEQNLTMGLVFSALARSLENFGTAIGYEREMILKTVKYVENSFKDARLTFIADALGVSAVTLSKAIKKHLGITFKSLLMQKRLAEAEKLIRNTDLPITEIIYFVGYENTNFFYRMFSAEYKVSPKEYRKSVRR